jgi:hypothetical protein
VLGQAVLGPVDHLTVHRIMEVILELVVLRHRVAQNICSSYRKWFHIPFLSEKQVFKTKGNQYIRNEDQQCVSYLDLD